MLASLLSCCYCIRRLPTDNHRLNGSPEYDNDYYNTYDEHGRGHYSHGLNNRRRRLLGTNVNVPIPETSDGHLVTNLPLLNPKEFTTKHWAGLLPSSPDGDKYFFYWLFAPDFSNIEDDETKIPDDKDIPLIIWLNGGPACSSMDGLFIENGPFRIVRNNDEQDGDGADWKIVADEHSWHKTPAYVVYIDQPVGTGISFTTSGKYPRNDNEVNVDFYYFLQEFLNFHKDKFLVQEGEGDDTHNKMMKRGIYFSGESHAGHYIPSMMNYIRKQNEKLSSSSSSSGSKQSLSKHNVYVPLKGAAIGNGWFDPRVQYSGHEAAYGYGIIGRAQRNALAEKELQCQQDIANEKYVSNHCFTLLDDIIDNSQGKKAPYEISQYDVTKWESTTASRKFPPGHEIVEAYLGGWNVPKSDGPKMSVSHEIVLQALHATPSLESGQRYKECTNPPYNALKVSKKKWCEFFVWLSCYCSSSESIPYRIDRAFNPRRTTVFLDRQFSPPPTSRNCYSSFFLTQSFACLNPRIITFVSVTILFSIKMD